MKISTKKTRAIIFIVLSIFLFGSSSIAQNNVEKKPSSIRKTQEGVYDPKAHKILQEVKKWYLSIKDRQVYFTYKLVDNTGKPQEYKGNITISENKFIIKLLSQEIFCDGKTLWSYLAQENEVSIHLYDPKDNINPLDAIKDYENKFRVKYIRQDTHEGKMRDILDLIPTTATNFHKIRLYTNPDDKKFHLLECYEKSGNILYYKIDKYVENVRFNKEIFSFHPQKYKNIQVNDLR